MARLRACKRDQRKSLRYSISKVFPYCTIVINCTYAYSDFPFLSRHQSLNAPMLYINELLILILMFLLLYSWSCSNVCHINRDEARGWGHNYHSPTPTMLLFSYYYSQNPARSHQFLDKFSPLFEHIPTILRSFKAFYSSPTESNNCFRVRMFIYKLA